MQTTFVSFPSTDDLLHHGLLYAPDQSTTQILVHVHGMGGSFYENNFVHVMARQLADAGWAMLTFNNRGHGHISEIITASNPDDYVLIGNAFERFEDCIEDIAGAIDFAAERGFTEIVLQGHSLGCSKVPYYLTQTGDQRIKRMILSAPADMVGLFEAEAGHTELMAEAKKLVDDGQPRTLVSHRIWETYDLSAATYLNFAIRGNAIDVINLYDSSAPSILRKIELPTLIYNGEKDDSLVVEPAPGLTALRIKFSPRTKLATAIIPEAGHTFVRKEVEAAQVVVEWLKSEVHHDE